MAPRNYLIHHKGKGIIRVIDPAETSSNTWGEILREFARDGDYAEAISLWSDCVTPQGITYDWELAGSAGASFRLHVWDETPEKAVTEAKKYLRQTRDVVYLSVLRLKRL